MTLPKRILEIRERRLKIEDSDWVNFGQAETEFRLHAPQDIECLERMLEVALDGLKRLSDKSYWYASVHQGPELEVHHALKVEVQAEADDIIAQIHAIGEEK